MVNVEDIENIAKAWFSTLSFRRTSELTGLDRATVRKYIEDGDPSRGIPPIKSSHAHMSKVVNLTETGRYLQQSAQQAESASRQLTGLLKELYGEKIAGLVDELQEALAMDDPVKAKQKRKAVLKELHFKDLPKLLEVDQLLWGKPTSRTEAKGDGTSAPEATKDQQDQAILQMMKEAGLIKDYVSPPATNGTGQGTAGN